MEAKRTHLNLKVPPSLKEKMEARAAAEKRPLGNLATLLLDWSYSQLEAAGDTVSLMRAPGILKVRRVSKETQEELYTALRLILERAPSTVIEDVVRKLTRLAGQYGDEK